MELSQEARDKLQSQKRSSTIASLLISMLSLILVGLILGFFLLQPHYTEPPVIVTYQSGVDDSATVQEKKVQTNMERKPSAPSSSMARVIAANAVSTVSIPVPDEVITEPSLSFGDGDDFGDGWGDGTGTGGGGASFFQSKVSAERIAFVIDYSASMRGKRDELMRAELSKSIEGLTAGTQYQLIFFAGPGWVAGNEVKSGKGGSTISDGGKKYKWGNRGGAGGFFQEGLKQVSEWLDSSSLNIKKSLKHIASTKLVWGTIWQEPLEMAMSMDPPPQVIFFMTDGAASRAAEAVKSVSKEANQKNIIINTFALMQPSAHKEMGDMTRLTGGEFTIIEADGSPRKVKIKGDGSKLREHNKRMNNR